MSKRTASSNQSFTVVAVLVWSLSITGCGKPTDPVFPPGVGKPTWNPPPVDSACVGGDADLDGACDANEVANGLDPTKPDSDGDGEFDGMDPKNGDSSGDGGSWLSPLFLALGGVGALSLLYNVVTKNDCQTQGAGNIYCNVETMWSKAVIGFNRQHGDHFVITVPVTVKREHWLTYGLNWADYDGTATYQYYFDQQLPSVTPDGCSANGMYYYRKESASAPAVPCSTQVTIRGDADGCFGKKLKQGGTGTILTFDNGQQQFCMDHNVIESIQTPAVIKAAIEAKFIQVKGSTGSYDRDYLYLVPTHVGTSITIPQGYQRMPESSFDILDPLLGNYKALTP
jgi:hypothetical protein